MKKIFALLGGVALLTSSFAVEVVSKPKPKYGPPDQPFATPLRKSNDYLSSARGKSSDFWSLISFYDSQRTGASCSVSAILPVLNSVRKVSTLKAADGYFTHKSLMERLDKSKNTKLKNYRKAVDGTALQMKGASLETVAAVLPDIFKDALQVTVEVQAVPMNPDPVKGKGGDAVDPGRLIGLRKALIENEGKDDNFVLVNFQQSKLTDDSDIGHWAVVAAFDEMGNPDKDRVLVLDPDRDYYEPYWVSLIQLGTAMTTKDSRGEKYRGYVTVKVLPANK